MQGGATSWRPDNEDDDQADASGCRGRCVADRASFGPTQPSAGGAYLPVQPAPGVFQNDTVNQGGQYLGRDPDPNVRSQILKDDSEYNGNGY